MDFLICTTLELESRTLSEIPQDIYGQIPQIDNLFEKFLRMHMTSPNSSHLYSLHRYKMSTDESLGSHQLNSFAMFLEENLHTSSESSKVQNPQVRKMTNGKRP